MKTDETLLEGRTTCSVEEAARYLGVGRSTAYAAARDGSLPTIRISNRILVPAAKLRALLGLEEAA
jgi:excisionase family DNA binding protein